jgi:hypothetical protein
MKASQQHRVTQGGRRPTLNDMKKENELMSNYLFNNFPPALPKDMYPGFVQYLNKLRNLHSLPPFSLPQEEAESDEEDDEEDEEEDSEEAFTAIEKSSFGKSGSKKPGFSRTFIIMSILGLILLLISIYLLFFRRSKNTAFGRRSRFGRRR